MKYSRYFLIINRVHTLCVSQSVNQSEKRAEIILVFFLSLSPMHCLRPRKSLAEIPDSNRLDLCMYFIQWRVDSGDRNIQYVEMYTRCAVKPLFYEIFRKHKFCRNRV